MTNTERKNAVASCNAMLRHLRECANVEIFSLEHARMVASGLKRAARALEVLATLDDDDETSGGDYARNVVTQEVRS